MNSKGVELPQTEKKHPLRVKWVKSAIGYSSQQGKVIQGLGLRKLNQVVERPDTPQIRGMIRAVAHLVQIVPSGEETVLILIPEYKISPKAKPTNKTKKVVSKKSGPNPPKKQRVLLRTSQERKHSQKTPKPRTKPLEVANLKPEEKHTKENFSKKKATQHKTTEKKI